MCICQHRECMHDCLKFVTKYDCGETEAILKAKIMWDQVRYCILRGKYTYVHMYVCTYFLSVA